MVSDLAGSRQATVYVPAGTQANLTFADGSQTAASTSLLPARRSTPWETADRRRCAGTLPESSAYTYAVEFSADEAEALGTQSIQFSAPVYGYIENYHGFPVGTPIPAAFYDRLGTNWVPVNNGVVLSILSIQAGQASVDVDGQGTSATSAELTKLGITADELQSLASLYTPGTTLWRVPLPHFSPFDWNGLSACTNETDCPNPPSGKKPGPPSCQKLKVGSIIQCETQDLAEELPIVGTPYYLRYDSLRSPARTAELSTQIELTGAVLPPSWHRSISR